MMTFCCVAPFVRWQKISIGVMLAMRLPRISNGTQFLAFAVSTATDASVFNCCCNSAKRVNFVVKVYTRFFVVIYCKFWFLYKHVQLQLYDIFKFSCSCCIYGCFCIRCSAFACLFVYLWRMLLLFVLLPRKVEGRSGILSDSLSSPHNTYQRVLLTWLV